MISSQGLFSLLLLRLACWTAFNRESSSIRNLWISLFLAAMAISFFLWRETNSWRLRCVTSSTTCCRSSSRWRHFSSMRTILYSSAAIRSNVGVLGCCDATSSRAFVSVNLIILSWAARRRESRSSKSFVVVRSYKKKKEQYIQGIWTKVSITRRRNKRIKYECAWANYTTTQPHI